MRLMSSTIATTGVEPAGVVHAPELPPPFAVKVTVAPGGM
jgi:hypothetical protein